MATCGVMPATLLEAFLSAGRVTGAGVEYLNVIYITGGNDDSAIECGENVGDPESLIVAKFFGVDSNGHLGLKILSA